MCTCLNINIYLNINTVLTGRSNTFKEFNNNPKMLQLTSHEPEKMPPLYLFCFLNSRSDSKLVFSRLRLLD